MLLEDIFGYPELYSIMYIMIQLICLRIAIFITRTILIIYSNAIDLFNVLTCLLLQIN